MTILELKVSVSEDVLRWLQEVAQRRNISIDTVVSEKLEKSFDKSTDEEILESIRQSMLDAFAGKTRPVDEVLAELKQEFDFDADES